MAIQSGLAWKIAWTEDLMGHHPQGCKAGHDWNNLAQGNLELKQKDWQRAEENRGVLG